MIITYRNPIDRDQTIDVHFEIYQNDFTARWKEELKNLLKQDFHIEKNYCFMGFVENNPRDVDFLCKEITTYNTIPRIAYNSKSLVSFTY